MQQTIHQPGRMAEKLRNIADQLESSAKKGSLLAEHVEVCLGDFDADQARGASDERAGASAPPGDERVGASAPPASKRCRGGAAAAAVAAAHPKKHIAAELFGNIDSPVAAGRGRGAAAPTLETAEALLSPETAFNITRPALSPETAEALWRHYLGDEIAGRLRADHKPGHVPRQRLPKGG